MAKDKKGSKPVFHVRARQQPDSEYMMTIGAVWPFREGSGYVVKLHALPVNWNGECILVAPREDE